MHRKTRFVCVSDTHGYTPSEAGFKMPPGDVLIHAGDLTNNGSMAELRKTMAWISQADFEIKIVIGGNHDVTLDPAFYAEHGRSFHGSNVENPQRCIELIAGSSVIFLQHQSAIIRLTRSDGPQTAFKVFGSPHSQFEGNWAFGYESREATVLWDQIPRDTDIVVTHTPPRSHCDAKPTGRHVGCDALRQRLSRIRPPLVICGHVHEGRGYERVRWGAADTVERVIRGTLPPRESKKQSLVDLTGKRDEPFDNDGFWIESRSTIQGSSVAGRSSAGMEHERQLLRRETCIVNAAIMATSWPHRAGKRFNAPIVVDLELPVWHDANPPGV
ncbi:uncharacterized protein PFLUO_LOCUS1642 [Penicillium psychrofluorescens]|uniref:uncharacterized protein n=1 Tax=Penicillium psychrofluorescens TaxID=3158075 RepID=UPI003CCDC5BC